MSSKNADGAHTATASTIYLGLDVHKGSITIAVLPEHATASRLITARAPGVVSVAASAQGYMAWKQITVLARQN